MNEENLSDNQNTFNYEENPSKDSNDNINPKSLNDDLDIPAFMRNRNVS